MSRLAKLFHNRVNVNFNAHYNRGNHQAIWDYTPKVDIWTGVVIGVGLLAAPVVLPIFAGMMRPVVKGVFKGVIVVYETGRDLISDTLEGAEGLLEEAKSEVKSELAKGKR